MQYPAPTEPGYYWAKLKTPSGGTLYHQDVPKGIKLNPEDGGWISTDWEIVEVWDNNGEGDEEFAVNVFGIPITQWIPDFFWGPKVDSVAPKGRD